MTIINQPRTSVVIQNAATEVENTGHRVLVIGQSLPIGSAALGLSTRIANADSEVALFGQGSMLASMVGAFKRTNQATRVDAIALADDAGAVKQSSVFEITVNSTPELTIAFTVTNGKALCTTPTPHGYNEGDVVYITGGQALGIEQGLSTIVAIDSPTAFVIDTAAADGNDSATVRKFESTNGDTQIIIGSSYDETYSVTSKAGDDPGTLLAVIESKINANFNSLYTANLVYTQAANTAALTVTAKNGGTTYNRATKSFNVDGANVALTITSTNGANDPSLTDVFDVIGSTRYQTIVWPYADNTQPLTELLDARFNVTGLVLDGVGFVPYTGSVQEIESQIGENSESVVYLCDYNQSDDNFKGSSQAEQGFKVAAYYAAIRALRLDNSAQVLGDLVISTFGTLDAFGGPALASKPYFNTPLSFVNVVDSNLGFEDSEIEQITELGGSVYGSNVSGTEVVMGELVTTYLTTSAGVSDDSFKFLNYVDTASQSREYFYNNLRARFSQSRLTNGDTIPGRDMANAALIKAFCKRLYQALSGEDFVLLEAGEEALNFFTDNLVVTLDTQAGSANLQMIVPLVTQFRNLNAVMQIAFSTNS